MQLSELNEVSQTREHMDLTVKIQRCMAGGLCDAMCNVWLGGSVCVYSGLLGSDLMHMSRD